MMNNKRYQYRYDWGNGSHTEWKTITGVGFIREHIGTWLMNETVTESRVSGLLERLDKLPLGGSFAEYHGVSHKMQDGVKCPVSEYVEFKRVA